MKSYDYYKCKDLTYPDKPRTPKIDIKDTLDAEKIRAHADAVESYNAAMITYQKEKDAYNDVKWAREDEFKKDALEETGWANDPKADKAYYYAWQQGHARGLEDVFAVLSNLAEAFLD